jgi:hypothetical protein
MGIQEKLTSPKNSFDKDEYKSLISEQAFLDSKAFYNHKGFKNGIRKL